MDMLYAKINFLCFLTPIIQGSWMMRVRRQRKLRIKLGWNCFDFHFILTYNCRSIHPTGSHLWELNDEVSSQQASHRQEISSHGKHATSDPASKCDPRTVKLQRVYMELTKLETHLFSSVLVLIIFFVPVSASVSFFIFFFVTVLWSFSFPILVTTSSSWFFSFAITKKKRITTYVRCTWNC